ncbi:hypothetical protein EOS_12970 [Caballeronia mineralivorans PML1(12)]|uniref:Uncharacterized protein n=1 Tax=Caballeronia mineralivorans PML1(12) TaxID=908627 RepID=A0A0J1CZ35_9BURK|nr:hypothetical protein EOS_12970 [Caballeronia mineralivorans PML1(12)]
MQKSFYEPWLHRHDPSNIAFCSRAANPFKPEAFFQPDRNCDSVRHADRFSLLIDGSDHFRVVREAIARAPRTMLILGWDIDSH